MYPTAFSIWHQRNEAGGVFVERATNVACSIYCQRTTTGFMGKKWCNYPGAIVEKWGIYRCCRASIVALYNYQPPADRTTATIRLDKGGV